MQGLETAPFQAIVSSTGREVHHPVSAMTSSFFRDQLISMVARFICEAKPGDILALPSMAALHKQADGRICLSRNGSLPTPLHEPLSHEIVATIERWGKEDLQEAA